MSEWDFGRVTSFLETVMADAERMRDWLQTQTAKSVDHAEMFRRSDDLMHEVEALKRLLKRERSRSR